MQKYQSPSCWSVSFSVPQQMLSASFSDNGSNGGSVGHNDAANGGTFGDARAFEPSLDHHWDEE